MLKDGALLPYGGIKGGSLAFMIEVLATLGGARFGFEASSFFVDEGNAPRIGQAFLLIDAGALAGRAVYDERIETLVSEMLVDEGVRLAGVRRATLERQAALQGITIAETLGGQLEKLAAGG